MLYDLFSDFFDDSFPVYVSKTHKTVPNEVCPVCHMSLAEFSQTGKLGCPKCYDAFRPYLAQALKNTHGNAEHTGKVSKNADKKIKIKRELELLEQELKKSVENQDFENAAVLRDKINALKTKEA